MSISPQLRETNHQLVRILLRRGQSKILRLIFYQPPLHRWSDSMNRKRGGYMKKTIMTLACALVAPLAFAQTETTTTQSTATNPVTGSTETTTTSTTTEGTVTTFTPGKTIVVKATTGDPISYTLGKTVRFVNKAGTEIKESMIRPGARVHVYYDGTGETRVVNRVVVDE
jgi:hypothetical protein